MIEAVCMDCGTEMEEIPELCPVCSGRRLIFVKRITAVILNPWRARD